jgi:Protein of unknown function (DUF3187)
MGSAKREARFSPAWTSPTDMAPFDRGRGDGVRQALGATLVAAMCLHPIQAMAEGFGPFPVRNFNPLQQLVLNMPGDRAAVLSPGTLDVRLELAETAAVYYETPANASAQVKFETLRNGLFLRYGVTSRLEVGVEIPLLYRYTGFMEGAIQAVERATTGLSPARNALNNVNYAYSITRNGQQIVNGTKGALGFGDSMVQIKYQLFKETSVMPALSLRTAVKLPTGRESEFFGSGSPDFGLGLALEKGLGSRWIVYGNLNGVFPTGRIAGLPLTTTISGIAAAEYLWSDNLSLTLQFDYYTTPFRNVGLELFDKGVTEIAAGFSYRFAEHWLGQFYAIENIDFITGGAADLTLAVLCTYRFQR